MAAVLPFGRFRSSGDRNLPHNFIIHNATMEIYSVEYWQEHWEELMDRVENGENIIVENSNGNRAVMTLADDERIRIHTTHDDAS